MTISRHLHLLPIALILLNTSCERKLPEITPTPQSTTAKTTQAQPQPEDTSYRFTTTGRVIAIGDLHGDMNATIRALRTANVIDNNNKWSAGNAVLVQTGDILDRGDDERAILDLFQRLQSEAEQSGGAIHTLIGNHEVMNIEGDFRYVTHNGFTTFENVVSPPNPIIETKTPTIQIPRALAFAPGGPYAKQLAKHHTIIMVNNTVFAHGSVLPKHVKYGIGKINRDVQNWMNNTTRNLPTIMSNDDAPTWSRRFSSPNLNPTDCQTLSDMLSQIGAQRMVIGHTPQKNGINSECNQRVWRIDVGLASHYGSNPSQVLEIANDNVRILREQEQAQ
ncbi:MAG: metallophosphoesterase [Polyangiaceae bacterium]|nr:metallophosphoesterase [Polyangiaceae bacterium]